MQEISIHLKRLGKKKIHSTTIHTNKAINTLEDLLIACVKSEVSKFNEKRENPHLLPFLTPSDIQKQSTSGKIGFGEIHNLDKATIEESIQVAIQGFKDGLFIIFINDNEIQELEQEIHLDQESIVTFLRMTFLTGTYW
ncbi:hypothetical protein [Aquimarina aquimarini]|uniref:hypothetical protein n=1 Tax=Aquimarina aquimarini TaxID=1191734 RepID=UPI001F3250F0|nr:hypothetical protein [Aquimarina aquimarini]